MSESSSAGGGCGGVDLAARSPIASTQPQPKLRQPPLGARTGEGGGSASDCSSSSNNITSITSTTTTKKPRKGAAIASMVEKHRQEPPVWLADYLKTRNEEINEERKEREKREEEAREERRVMLAQFQLALTGMMTAIQTLAGGAGLPPATATSSTTITITPAGHPGHDPHRAPPPLPPSHGGVDGASGDSVADSNGATGNTTPSNM